MHTYSAPGGTRIFYNSDASGTAIISYDGREMEVPGGDIVPLVLIARDLAESEPYCATHTGDIECALCNGEEGETGDYRETFRHEAGCPFGRAKALTEEMAR